MVQSDALLKNILNVRLYAVSNTDQVMLTSS